MGFKRGRAQVSMEFFLVTMFAFLIIVPLIMYFTNQSQRAVNEVNTAQVVQIARTIVTNAETVYAFGEPTTFTLRVYLPEGVDSIYFNNTEISFVINSEGRLITLTERATMNVTGNMSTHRGIHRLRLQAANNSVVISEISN